MGCLGAAGAGKTDAPIVVRGSSAQNMTSSTQDLNNPADRAAITKESDMGYVNINGQARVFVQTGMNNTRQDSGSTRLLGMASLSVRSRWGLPFWVMSRHRWPTWTSYNGRPALASAGPDGCRGQ